MRNIMIVKDIKRLDTPTDIQYYVISLVAFVVTTFITNILLGRDFSHVLFMTLSSGVGWGVILIVTELIVRAVKTKKLFVYLQTLDDDEFDAVYRLIKNYPAALKKAVNTRYGSHNNYEQIVIDRAKVVKDKIIDFLRKELLPFKKSIIECGGVKTPYSDLEISATVSFYKDIYFPFVGGSVKLIFESDCFVGIKKANMIKNFNIKFNSFLHTSNFINNFNKEFNDYKIQVKLTQKTPFCSLTHYELTTTNE